MSKQDALVEILAELEPEEIAELIIDSQDIFEVIRKGAEFGTDTYHRAMIGYNQIERVFEEWASE